MSEVAPPSPDPEEPLTFRVMNCEGVTYNLSDSSPQMHLMESELPFRSISIPIALAEAYALHHALQHELGRRPSTHELTGEILARLQADIIATRLVRYENGVFYAELDLMTPRGRERFDARASDAVILALRQSVPAPILCSEEVLSTFYS